MADFNKAFKNTMEHEGGYVDDKDDRGGETYRGVSRNNFPDWKVAGRFFQQALNLLNRNGSLFPDLPLLIEPLQL